MAHGHHREQLLRFGFPRGLLVLSAGIGLTFVPITLLATSGVEARGRLSRSGLYNTMS